MVAEPPSKTAPSEEMATEGRTLAIIGADVAMYAMGGDGPSGDEFLRDRAHLLNTNADLLKFARTFQQIQKKPSLYSEKFHELRSLWGLPNKLMVNILHEHLKELMINIDSDGKFYRSILEILNDGQIYLMTSHYPPNFFYEKFNVQFYENKNFATFRKGDELPRWSLMRAYGYENIDGFVRKIFQPSKIIDDIIYSSSWFSVFAGFQNFWIIGESFLPYSLSTFVLQCFARLEGKKITVLNHVNACGRRDNSLGSNYSADIQVATYKNRDELMDKVQSLVNGTIELEKFSSRLSSFETGVIQGFSREGNLDNPGLNADKYALVIKRLLEINRRGEFSLALLGHWGRGKTYLIKQVARILAAEKDRAHTRAPKFEVLNFSAWKYPATPTLWAYLYQMFFKRALNDNLVTSLPRKFRANCLKHGPWPFLNLLILLTIILGFTIIVPILDLNRFFNSKVLTTAVTSGALIALAYKWYLQTATTISPVLKRFLRASNHKEKLGVQATVGEDFQNLIRSWLVPISDEGFRQVTPENSRGTMFCNPWNIGLFIVSIFGILFYIVHIIIPAENIKIHTWSALAFQSLFLLFFIFLLLLWFWRKTLFNVCWFDGGGVAKDYEIPFIKPAWASWLQVFAGIFLAFVSYLYITNFVYAKGLETYWLSGLFWFPSMALFQLTMIWLLFTHWERLQLVLVIDDLDRLPLTDMLHVTESLKLFLDEECLKSKIRLIVLVDDEPFGLAIREKHQCLLESKTSKLLQELKNDPENGELEDEVVRLTALQLTKHQIKKENFEKLFLAHLRLEPLTKDETLGVAKLIGLELVDSHADVSKASGDQSATGALHEGEQSATARTTASADHTGADREKEPAGDQAGSDPHVDGPTERGKQEQMEQGEPTRANSLPIALTSEERDKIEACFEKASPTYRWSPRGIRSFFFQYQLARELYRELSPQQLKLETLETLIAELFKAIEQPDYQFKDIEDATLRSVLRMVC